jgi:mono/diheme cytochrome c family protein
MNRSTIRWSLAGVGLAAIAAFAQCNAPRALSSDDAAHSRAAFEVVYQVLTHPRCANCHPAGDAPLQGDQGVPHGQNVLRGPAGRGVFGLDCASCHQAQNFPGEHMPPGVPDWHMPPPETPMVFAGTSRAELARQLADPAQNGNRSAAELLRHAAEDPLVLWGWNPGDGRAPVPVPHQEFIAALRKWIELGCLVPE